MSKGGWPFSTSAHGWPISDCTSEGLKATLCLLHSKTIKSGLKDGSVKPISDERLYDAVNVLLTYQNEDGGTLKEMGRTFITSGLFVIHSRVSTCRCKSGLFFALFQVGQRMRTIEALAGMSS